ncbi:hypothetical protein ACER0C_002363 [Sarotherodon galilaeus]
MSAVTASLCSTLMFVLFVSADQKTITAESGQNITLTCRAPNNNITFVEWSRADLGDKNVLLYQDGHFEPDGQHPSFKNRVDLQDRQMKDGDVSLILKDVTINDAGTYECRAQMKEIHSWKNSIFSMMDLTVVVPPDQEMITAGPGQDVTLPCRASNNNITSVKWSRADLEDKHVLWYQDGQFVPDNQHPSFKNRVDLQDRQMKDGDVYLILKDVTTADTGIYECRAFMVETLSWQLNIIYLRVVPPKYQEAFMKAVPGQDVTLTSRAPNNNITAVKWSRADLADKHVLLYRDGHFDPDHQHPSFKNRVDLQDRQMKDGDVSLILKDVTINDAGTYECRVQREGDRLNFINIIYLRVVPPDQKIITESGQDVTLTCRAPNNNIGSVQWIRGGLEPEVLLFYQDGHVYPDINNQSVRNRVDLQDSQIKDGDVSLILKKVTINDAGPYLCYVYIKEPEIHQISIIHLHVDPPDQKIITDPDKTITAESGQNVTLTSRALNNNITAVKWSRADLGDEYVLLYQDGHFDTTNQHPSFKNRVDLQDRQMKDGDVSLILKDVTINDTGTYECRVAQNSEKNMKLISQTSLIVADKFIEAEYGQDVTLRCQDSNNKNIRSVKWIRPDLGEEYVFLYQDGHFVSANQHPSFKNRVDLQDRQMKDGDVSLILKDVTINDTGRYVCDVQRQQGDMKLNIYLRVVDPPDQENITAESGQDVTLTSRAPNNNRGVKWSRTDLEDKYVLLYQDGHFVSANQHPSFYNRVDLQDRQMKDGDVSLILKDVTTNDSGRYMCGDYMEETRSWKSVSIIYLRVVDPPGPSGGIIALIVAVLVLLLFVGVGFLIYRKHKVSRYSNKVPTENNEAPQQDCVRGQTEVNYPEPPADGHETSRIRFL